MQENFGAISARSVLAWAGPLNYRLGRYIAAAGEIFDCRRDGASIVAFCQEISPPPWRVQAKLHGGDVEAASCTCAGGASGRCPHVVAVLLAFQSDPGRFEATNTRDFALESQSKSELIEIIHRLLSLRPSPQDRLQTYPASVAQENGPTDLPTLRRYASYAFMVRDCEYETAIRVADDLERSLKTGNDSLADGGYQKAHIIFLAVVLAILDYSEVVTVLVNQDDGELLAVLKHAIASLADGLIGHESDAATRKKALGTLFDAHMEDLNYGGSMFSGKAGEMIVEHATEVERASLVAWIRGGMPTGQTWPDHVRRQLRGRFLLEVGQRDLDEESALQICRECGLVAELTDRLLPSGRFEDALDEIGSVWESDLPEIGEAFRRHGYADIILPWLDERFKTRRDRKLAEWLKRMHLDRAEYGAALPMAEFLFEGDPGVAEYLEFRDLAVKAGKWDRNRPRALIKFMSAADVDLLADVYFEAGEFESSVELAAHWDVGDWYLERLNQVVEEFAESNPGQSAANFRRLAEICIERRGRKNYQKACKLLIRARDLMLRMKLDSDWQEFIAELRQRNDFLPALRDELARFGI